MRRNDYLVIVGLRGSVERVMRKRGKRGDGGERRDVHSRLQ
jgi:hypothetical protein